MGKVWCGLWTEVCVCVCVCVGLRLEKVMKTSFPFNNMLFVSTFLNSQSLQLQICRLLVNERNIEIFKDEITIPFPLFSC